MVGPNHKWEQAQVPGVCHKWPRSPCGHGALMLDPVFVRAGVESRWWGESLRGGHADSSIRCWALGSSGSPGRDLVLGLLLVFLSPAPSGGCSLGTTHSLVLPALPLFWGPPCRSPSDWDLGCPGVTLAGHLQGGFA